MAIFVTDVGPRPDWRLVKTFVWAEGHPTDSDGNARHPTDKSWTDLWVRERVAPHARFEIEPHPTLPRVLAVTATADDLGSHVAYYLARETGGRVHEGTPDGAVVSLEELARRIGAEWLRAALERLTKSRWQRATDDNPYPPA